MLNPKVSGSPHPFTVENVHPWLREGWRLFFL